MFFPQEPVFRDSGFSVHSSVLVVEMNSPQHILKELSTLDKIFATDSLLKSVHRQSRCG